MDLSLDLHGSQSEPCVVDPKLRPMDLRWKRQPQRASPGVDDCQVLKHKWITGGAPDVSLTGAKDQLRKYNATRKLKKAAQGIMAGARLAKLSQM